MQTNISFKDHEKGSLHTTVLKIYPKMKTSNSSKTFLTIIFTDMEVLVITCLFIFPPLTLTPNKKTSGLNDSKFWKGDPLEARKPHKIRTRCVCSWAVIVKATLLTSSSRFLSRMSLLVQTDLVYANWASREIMILFVLRIHASNVHAQPSSWARCLIFGRPFVYFHTSCVRTAKALVRLRGCAGSPEPSLVACVISAIISWAGSIETLIQPTYTLPWCFTSS